MTPQPLLSVEALSICFQVGSIVKPVVEDVSFAIRQGETLALVGESGSGKTLTGRSLIHILPKLARVTGGRAVLTTPDFSADLLALSSRKIQSVRGGRVAMVFQEPMSSLSPLHTIGDQVSESLRLHEGVTGAAARRRTMETFEQVGFPEPERIWRAYPFELSGGLRQRAMIAMAMICRPNLLIADEPTTALDVTTQAMVLDLIRSLQAETGMAVMLVTHDLGVVANMAHSVAVLRKGRLVESGPAEAVLNQPGHGYTQALIAAAPEIPDDLAGAQPPVPDAPIWRRPTCRNPTPLRRAAWAARPG